MKEPLWALLLVTGLHVGILGLMIWSPSPKTQEIILPPTVQGILIPAPPAEIVQAPTVAEVPPPPEPKPTPKPLPKVEPKKVEPKPVPPTPPSEKAITPPPAEDQVVSPPVTAASKDETLTAPVTPPREDADHLNNPRPAYPHLSRRLREQGTVILEVLILPTGKVGEVRIKESSGFKRLDDVAIKAVQQWTYVPARQGDEAIAYWYLQPLEFSLN